VLDVKSRVLGADRIVIGALDGLMRFFSDLDEQQNQMMLLHRWLAEQGMSAGGPHRFLLVTKAGRTITRIAAIGIH
jgi:hypothetical protein